MKTILRKSSETKGEDWETICQQTRLVLFLSTPHHGADIANAVKVLTLGMSSKHIDLLTNNSGVLSDINSAFVKFVQHMTALKVVTYYEKHKTLKIAVVVSRESANPGVSGIEPVAFDKDHIGICKPTDRDDPLFLGVLKHVKKVVSTIPNPSSNGLPAYEHDDYASRDEKDRRDLLQKLIDAGREHEYEIANNHQSKFARRYIKMGLRTPERSVNDKLLSEVAQRFQTHVYSGLICQDATDSEVRKAIQENVVDPIVEKNQHHDGFGPTTVMQALYYLTEQCHIRWDKVL